MFIIMYQHPGQEPEEIDEFDTKEEARNMLIEYKMAYPAGSKLWIKKEK